MGGSEETLCARPRDTAGADWMYRSGKEGTAKCNEGGRFVISTGGSGSSTTRIGVTSCPDTPADLDRKTTGAFGKSEPSGFSIMPFRPQREFVAICRVAGVFPN